MLNMEIHVMLKVISTIPKDVFETLTWESWSQLLPKGQQMFELLFCH